MPYQYMYGKMFGIVEVFALIRRLPVAFLLQLPKTDANVSGIIPTCNINKVQCVCVDMLKGISQTK